MDRRADRRASRDNITMGLLAALGVTVCFAIMDALAKLLSQTYDPFYIVWVRYMGQAVVTLAVFAPVLGTVARARRPGLQVVRSTLLLGATLFFFASFAFLPLAEVTAIAQIAPLIITGLAALVLGEQIGPLRWAAVGAGFIGALIIIQPGSASFQPAAFLALCGALSFAMFSIATRFLGSEDSIQTTFFFTGIVGSIFASIAVPFVWVVPAMADLPAILAIGVFGAGGQALLIVAMRYAPASTVAPLLYVQLLWSTILGFALFGDVPGATTLWGAALIVAAGLFVRLRETRG
ncbi:MAG: DMT family transporter [Pseudomonadota bacterium]